MHYILVKSSTSQFFSYKSETQTITTLPIIDEIGNFPSFIPLTSQLILSVGGTNSSNICIFDKNIEKQEEIYTDLTEKNKNYRSFNHLLSIIHSSKIFDNVTELQKLAFYVRQSSSMIPGNPLYIKF